MLVAAGLSLKNLNPHVWDPESPYHLSSLQAVMVSYADFHRMPAHRSTAMERGLHAYLGVPEGMKVYLDNGSFYFLQREGETAMEEYEEFVRYSSPDWYPVPRDFIPAPRMMSEEYERCFELTMGVNSAYQQDGYVPVLHVGKFLEEYIAAIAGHEKLSRKEAIALGGIVPNLLRTPKAAPYNEILNALIHVRQAFADKEVHVFGIGGTATLHLAALLGVDSVDSSGWRNRAARGVVQLPGSGERSVAELGSWKGRKLSSEELETLTECQCPACRRYGLEGLKARGLSGFCNRATHNLWILLEEVRWIEEHAGIDSYSAAFRDRLDNSTYRPLIETLLNKLSTQL